MKRTRMTPAEYLEAKFRSDRVLKCWICGGVLGPSTATVDHLIPKSARKSKRRTDSKENYRLAHKECNGRRGDSRLSKEQILTLKGRAPSQTEKDRIVILSMIAKAQHQVSTDPRASSTATPPA